MTKVSSGLKELQNDFCLSLVGGDHSIEILISSPRGHKKRCNSLLRKNRMAKTRRLESLPLARSPKEIIREFWVSPNTKVIDRVAFDPTPQPETTLNYYVGHTGCPPATHISWSMARND